MECSIRLQKVSKSFETMAWAQDSRIEWAIWLAYRAHKAQKAHTFDMYDWRWWERACNRLPSPLAWDVAALRPSNLIPATDDYGRLFCPIGLQHRVPSQEWLREWVAYWEGKTRSHPATLRCEWGKWEDNLPAYPRSYGEAPIADTKQAYAVAYWASYRLGQDAFDARGHSVVVHPREYTSCPSNTRFYGSEWTEDITEPSEYETQQQKIGRLGNGPMAEGEERTLPYNGLALVVKHGKTFLASRPSKKKRNKGRMVSFLRKEWQEVTTEDGHTVGLRSCRTVLVKDRQSRANNEDRDLWERKKMLADSRTGDTLRFKVSDWRASLSTDAQGRTVPAIAPSKNWDHAGNAYPTGATKSLAAIACSG